jgi:hypothetical protein
MRATLQPFATLQKMQSVCVPEHETSSGYGGDACGIALVIAFTTSMAVLAKIIVLDEATSDRTQILLLVIGSSAFLAAFITALFVVWLACRWNPVVRAVTASLASTVLFIPAAMFCFAIENRIIKGNLEPGAIVDGRIGEIVWSMIGAMGLFAPTGMRYLVPWPLLVMGLMSLLIFYRWPSEGMDQK